MDPDYQYDDIDDPNLTQEDLVQIMSLLDGDDPLNMNQFDSGNFTGMKMETQFTSYPQTSNLFPTAQPNLFAQKQSTPLFPTPTPTYTKDNMFMQQQQSVPFFAPKPEEGLSFAFEPKPMFVQQDDQSTQTLNKLQAYQMAQNDQLDKIKQLQKQVLNQPQKESFDLLVNQHEELKKQIAQELQTLSSLLQTVVLSPFEITKILHLAQEFQLQNMQLELLNQELQQLVQPNSPTRYFVALVIAEQPMPMVITKKKALDEPVIIKLLTGANTNVQYVSPVKVILNMDTSHIKGSNPKNIETESEKLDDTTKIAKFHLKFLNGTRKTLATVKFVVQVQLQGGPALTLESNTSNQFIVITNPQTQYEDSDGMLLKVDIFGPQADSVAPWPLFANKLQYYFLRGTRQDPVKPQRYLTKTELMYLHIKFFVGQQCITSKMFDSFWNWFGKGLQKIRYQRHLCSMWQAGLLYGFISREGVNAALANQEAGTFLIRFSERHPGSFAIGYTIEDRDPIKRVRHYLVKPEEVSPPNKTLPHYLMDCPQLTKFLVIYDFASGNPKHRLIDKELVLEQYGIKKAIPMTSPDGYDDKLHRIK